MWYKSTVSRPIFKELWRWLQSSACRCAECLETDFQWLQQRRTFAIVRRRIQPEKKGESKPTFLENESKNHIMRNVEIAAYVASSTSMTGKRLYNKFLFLLKTLETMEINCRRNMHIFPTRILRTNPNSGCPPGYKKLGRPNVSQSARNFWHRL